MQIKINDMKYIIHFDQFNHTQNAEWSKLCYMYILQTKEQSTWITPSDEICHYNLDVIQC